MKLDKYKGCLIGGAIGDALGYAVEFIYIDEIVEKYGEPGIRDYELTNGVAQISDDTQMTLFTASGLLMGKDYLNHISLCYKDWLLTQFNKFPLENENPVSPLMEVKELYSSRAPGGTCINAIREGANGSIEKPLNNSKGCGGIMRVAPIGLFFNSTEMDIRDIDKIGADVAALTHGHPLGWLSAAALVHIIARIVHEDFSVSDAIADMKVYIKEQFRPFEDTEYMMQLVDKAVELAGKDCNDREAIRQLGEGWVAEETLAIAIYCALKYQDDFEAAMITAVNHDGDSDSTGAVTGNILGAALGMAEIPNKFIGNLELKDVIIKMAELFQRDKSTVSRHIKNVISSGYFDLAEISAIEHRPVHMEDYMKQLV